MDPWKPKYKALHDTIDNIRDMLQLLSVVAALFVIVIITI